MIELSAANTGDWLTGHGIALADAVFSELGGGVSNTVVLVEGSTFRAVVKQSLGRLRVEQEWLSSRERILREAAAMRWLSGRLTNGRVPRVLLEAPEDFAIVIEAAPADFAMWKSNLMEGTLDARTSKAAGELLAGVIRASWKDPEAQMLFEDRSVFEELRIDPYYRFTASRHPAVAPYFEGLIARSSARSSSLTHGDFSPKNLLVSGAEVWAIDWEAVHFGDPSFDVAFLWNHLLLKSILTPRNTAGFRSLAVTFTDALEAGLPPDAFWVVNAALEHLPALLLARVDGKSPVEYLDPGAQARARQLALRMIAKPGVTLEQAFAL